MLFTFNILWAGKPQYQEKMLSRPETGWRTITEGGCGKNKITKARVWDLSLALPLHLSLLVLPTSTAHTSRFLYQGDVVQQLLPLISFHLWRCRFPSLQLIYALCQWEPPRAPWCLSRGCYIALHPAENWGPPNKTTKSQAWVTVLRRTGWLLLGFSVEAVSPLVLGTQETWGN